MNFSVEEVNFLLASSGAFLLEWISVLIFGDLYWMCKRWEIQRTKRRKL
jgi:hypothetical protein